MQRFIKLRVQTLNLERVLFTLGLVCIVGLKVLFPSFTYRRGRWQSRGRRVGDGWAGGEEQARCHGARGMGWSK